MKIIPNVPIAGVGFCYTPGNEYDIDDAEADRLIDAGQATAADPNHKPKTKPQPVHLDQKPSQPVEKVEAVKPAPAAGTNGLKPDQSPAGQTSALTTAVPTAVDAIKKGGK